MVKTTDYRNPVEHGKNVIFGGFSSKPVDDEAGYTGDENCFIFSILPACRHFKHLGSLKGENFVIFNGQGRIPGLGFGGKSVDKCRIWIDKNMKSKSFLTVLGDETYQPGILTPEGATGPIQIEYFEAWTFSNLEDKKLFFKEIKE